MYNTRELSEITVKVSRKGQVTIPAVYRRRYRIREGSKMMVREAATGLLFEPVPTLEDLAGIDAGQVGLEAMRAELDRMREQDRY